jgi:hypothetical protein
MQVGGDCILRLDALTADGVLAPDSLLQECRRILLEEGNRAYDISAFRAACIQEPCDELTMSGHDEVDLLVEPLSTPAKCEDYAYSLGQVVLHPPVRTAIRDACDLT